MDLNQLRGAVALADHGTFTRAAAALHMTQPSLSYTIGRLESELGTRLFERLPTGVIETSAGAALVLRARAVLNEADAVAADVSAVLGVVSGRLRLITVRTASLRLAEILGAFHADHPAVSLSLDEPGDDLDVATAVLHGRCDVGLMRRAAVPPGLCQVDVGSQEIVAIFPPGTAPAGDSMRYQALRGRPMIAPRSGTAARALHDSMFADAAVEPPVVVECEQHELALALVVAGVGFALTTANRAKAMDPGSVEVRRLRPYSRNPLSLVYRSDPPDPAAAAFIELTVGEAAKEPRTFW